jgi:serine-type D-Ala-D-Ala carboxypeptidase (penicillin-binding protein 5/6)
MNIRWQSIILIVLIIISFTLTRFSNKASISADEEVNNKEIISNEKSSNISYQKASFSDFDPLQKVPTRKWDIFDPELSAEAVLIHSLDDDFRLYYENTREEHVLASLTKLMTAVVVIENIGINKKIPITQKAIDTQGFTGDLKSGEVYSARDLLKIMLLTSSNDAAAAFEEYLGGKDNMARAIHKKAAELDMKSIIVEDGSGLSDFNYGNAYDLLKIIKYIIKNHPEIFTWTQNRSFLIQPLNEPISRKVYNINNIVERKDFIGGKTGTSEVAGENLISIFSIEGRRVAFIILGSKDRYKDAVALINWIKEAYTFPEI